MMAVHKCQKEVELALLKQNSETMTKQVNEIHEKIMGNGKPGIVDDINSFKGALRATQIIFGVLIALAGIVIAVMK